MFLFLFLCTVKGKSAFNTGHARQFRFPFTFIQTDALRKCLAVLDLLRHPEVAERSGGKLWPVRNQKHLAALGKSFEPFRNLVEGEPADTGFGSRVSRFTRCTVYAPHGGNVDDPSASV